MPRHILTLSLVVFLALVARAQSDPEVKKIIPPTPNAAGLGQVGNVPIGLYTGQPNVSFPLYNIEYNDITVPIVLSYNYSGFKVEDYPGWVGLGWTVGGTGVINRQRRGLPDESLHGYNGQLRNGEKAVQFITSQNVQLHTAYLDRVRKGLADSEPDLFTFSFPGHSGKFFFDETQCGTTTKQAVVIPHQKIKIFGYFNYSGIYNWETGIIEKFVVIDEKGVIYTFDVAERAASSEPGDPDVENFANTWYLSELETPNGNTVNYQYRTRVMDMPPTVYEKRTIPRSHPTTATFTIDPTLQFTASSVNEAVLERIIFRNGSVDFIEGGTRGDWDPSSWTHSKEMATEQPKTLSKIRVSVSGKNVKDIEFSYSYFGSNARLRLDSFREVNGTDAKPPYVFTYQGGTMPGIGLNGPIFRQDHWGYFRGGNETTLLPSYTDVAFQPDGSFFFINFSGNERSPSPLDASAGMLKKITYPTKGYTSFEYEANSYWGDEQFNICSGEFEGAGVAGATVNTFGSDIQTTTITLATTSCVKVKYILEAPCVDGVAEIKLYNSSGVTILRHSIERKISGALLESHSGPDDEETFALPQGTYTLFANAINENSCGSITRSKATFSKIVQVAGGFSNRVAGGLRVSKMSDCTDDEHCVSSYYDYRDIADSTKSSGTLINPPVYTYDQPIEFANGEGTATFLVPCTNLVAHSEVALTSTSGGVVGYKYVTVRKTTNDSQGRTENQFASADEYPDGGSMEYPFPPLVSDEWKRGTLRVKREVGAVAPGTKILVEQTSDYCINQTYSRQVALKPKLERDSRAATKPVTLNDYTFVSYSITSGWSPICSQQDIQYDHSGASVASLTSTKNFYYDNSQHLQLSRIVSTDSKGEQFTTRMKYPDDVASIPGLTAPEIAGIQSNPDKTALVEKRELKGTTLLNTTLNIYDGPSLKKVRFANGAAPLEEHISYDLYDQFGNVLDVTTIKGEHNSYQWAYAGKFPVVEAKNAASPDVYFTSFEDVGSVFEDPNSNNLAFSGSKVLNSGNYTIPASFVPSSPSNTKMSYWYWDVDQWKFSGILPFSANITSTGTRLDEVRAFPKGALITTLTYDPAFGVMTGVADANSMSSHYEYDDLGRLVRIRDFKGNIVKEFAYHYKND